MCLCQTRTRRARPTEPCDVPQQQPCQRAAKSLDRRSAAQSVFGQPPAAAARAGRLHAAPLHADLGRLGQARAARPVHHLEPLVHLVALGLGPRLAHVHGDLARRPPHVVQARGLGDAGVPAEARVAGPQRPAVAARLRSAALAPRPAARRGVAPPARLRSPQRRAPQARGASAHAGRGTSRRARACTRRRRSTAARAALAAARSPPRGKCERPLAAAPPRGSAQRQTPCGGAGRMRRGRACSSSSSRSWVSPASRRSRYWSKMGRLQRSTSALAARRLPVDSSGSLHRKSTTWRASAA